MKRKLFLLAVLTVGLASAALAQSLLTYTPPSGLCNDKWGLYTQGGYTDQQGFVTIGTDCNNLTLTFQLWNPAASFGKLCVWIGNDISNLPMVGGMPAANQFDQTANGMCTNATGMTTFTWTIPVSELTMVDVKNLYNQNLNIVTVAEVDTDGVEGTPYELAYAGNVGQKGDLGQYWNYGVFQFCCNVSSCDETAFAKGTHVWTTGPKSNPDGLPSLNLSKNRWGWAIQLMAGQANAIQTYNIFAGAGLNDTRKGTLVGTLDVLWTGTQVTLTYHMLAGYTLGEVHIYANDVKPTKVAPGQYGHTFAPHNAGTFGPVTFSVADSNGDGIWLIAHDVVDLGCGH